MVGWAAEAEEAGRDVGYCGTQRAMEKKPEFSVRDLIVSKNCPPAAGGVLFSS